MEAVKAFVKGYTTSKTSTRRKLLADLSAAAENGGARALMLLCSYEYSYMHLHLCGFCLQEYIIVSPHPQSTTHFFNHIHKLSTLSLCVIDLPQPAVKICIQTLGNTLFRYT